MPEYIQPALDLQWYARHRHGVDAPAHQHFPDGSEHGDHGEVALVPFAPDILAHIGEVRDDLEQVRGANQVLFAKLVGQGAQIDPVGVVMLRVTALLDAILDQEARDRYELKFETLMAGALHQALDEVRRARLLAPLQAVPPGHPGNGSALIVPGR